MGNAEGREKEQEISKNIDRELRQDIRRLNHEVQILLLGTQESGRHSIRKQLGLTHSETPLSDDEKNGHKTNIQSFVLKSIKALVEKGSVKASDVGSTDALTEELATKFKAVWAKNEVKQAALGLPYSYEARYFFNEIDRIARGSFAPEVNDIIYSPPSGGDEHAVVDSVYSFENFSCRLVDVGQRWSDRKKWIDCFENVAVVIFCVGLDESTTQLEDSLKLFEELCSIKWMEKGTILVYLTKLDLFKEQLPQVPLKKHFASYTGPENDSDAAVEFVKQQFINKKKATQKVEFKPTTSTDSANVNFLLEKVKGAMLDSSLNL